MKKFRQLILYWLFGTDDIDRYMQLLRENMGHCEDGIKHAEECIELINDHKRTLKREEWFVETTGKLLRICENHGIDVDEEIKHIQLDEVNANDETLD